MEIELINLTVKMGDRCLYDDVSFTFTDQDYQLCGANGCGKTTLLDCIYKLNTQYEGSIKVDGCDIKKIKTSNLRSKMISYVRQKDIFINSLSVSDNIILIENDKVVIANVLTTFTKITNIDPTTKVSKLSGGERQVLNVIYAVLTNSQIIFIDEPYNNISVARRIVLEKYIANCQKMIIMTDHSKLNMATSVSVKGQKLVQDV